MSEIKQGGRLAGDAMMLAVAAIWGLVPVLARAAVTDDITPLWFAALRLAVALPVLMALFGRRALAMPPRSRAVNSAIGAVFVSAYLFGTVSLTMTTAGNNMFLNSLFVVLVPICACVSQRHLPSRRIVTSVALCTAGTLGLVLGSGGAVNAGDLFALLGMVCVSAHVLLVQKFAAGGDPLGMALWQTAGGLVLAAASAAIFEPIPSGVSAATMGVTAFSGTVGFALTITLQNIGQKLTSATHAAIILSTSGVFASVLGVFLLGEPMTARIFVSCALMFAGIIIAELPSQKIQTADI